MMQITDVIKVMGNAPLERFPWGCTVKDTLNLFLDSRVVVLTMKSTGTDIQQALDSLPDDVRALVLRANLDPSRHCIETPMGGGMVVEHSETGDPVESPGESLNNALLKPISIISAFSVLVVVVFAVYMVSGLTANKDVNWEELLKNFLEVFNLTSG